MLLLLLLSCFSRVRLLWSLERGLGIALQAMLEKKAVMSRKWGRLVGFLYLWRQCLVSHEV